MQLLLSLFIVGYFAYAQEQNTCLQLPADVCAATCIPFNAGEPSQEDFGCGDWWLTARCCNGSEPHTLVTTVYFDCFCQGIGMTTKGMGTIVALAVLACGALLAAVFYVLHRKRARIEAEEEERDKAMEEAQVYLPR